MHDPEQARAYFPRGLFQPPGSFRFSTDALLLAEFAAESVLSRAGNRSKTERLFADLGTGCGVVGLAYLLRAGGRGIGIDSDPELTAAAAINAQMLGLEQVFDTFTGDVSDPLFLRDCRKSYGLVDTVLCNPPWKLETSGRLPPDASRRRALFGDASTLSRFFRAAAQISTRQARLFCISGAFRTGDVWDAMTETGWKPSRLCFVHATKEAQATCLLCEAQKAFRGRLCVEAPCIISERPFLIGSH